MHILIAIGTIIMGILIWSYRLRAAREAVDDISDLASDVMAAARRLGFRRTPDTHPVDAIDDANLAAGALSVAFLDLGARQTDEGRRTHIAAFQRHLGMSSEEAQEMLVLGPFFVNACNGPLPGVARLGRQLRKLGGNAALDPALQVINDVVSTTGGLNDTQRDALHDLSNIFRR